MPILSNTEILELHDAALTAGLAPRRVALLGGIDERFVQGLAVATSPTAQLLQDLDALSEVDALADGTVPLAVWLANAEALAKPRVETATFARYRARVAPGGAAPAVEAQAQPPPQPVSPERLLDALVGLLPAQFEIVVFKLAVPPAYLSSASAPQAARSTELLQWAKQQGRLDDVARVLGGVAGARG